MNLLIAFHHATLIDGTGREPIPDATLTVRDGRIAYAGEARTLLPTPDEDVLNINFTGKYILPGMIDCHVHLAASGEAHGRIDGDDGAVTLRILNNARRSLAAGITTVRDLGGWNDLEFSVRESIRRGEFCGPRLFLAGRCIAGSEAAAAKYAGRYRIVKGLDEVRKAAREQIRRGADVLEVGMTGSLLVQEDAPAERQMTGEEVSAVVDEAAKAQRRCPWISGMTGIPFRTKR